MATVLFMFGDRSVLLLVNKVRKVPRSLDADKAEVLPED